MGLLNLLGAGPGVLLPRWSPADLPGIAPSLSVALQRGRGLLWQNTGKTVPAVAATDPVRVATCPWTGVDYVAPSDAARPLLYDEGGGKWSLSFDGVDDYLSAPWVGTAAVTMAAAVRLASAGSFPIVIAASVTKRELRFIATARRPETITDDGALSVNSASVLALDTWARVLAACGASGASTELYTNNIQVGQDAADTTASVSSTAIYVGSRNGTLFLPGRVAGTATVGSKVSVPTVGMIDAYLAGLLP